MDYRRLNICVSKDKCRYQKQHTVGKRGGKKQMEVTLCKFKENCSCKRLIYANKAHLLKGENE